MLPKSSTNLRYRVQKLNLPRTKALYPLFEVISNSIHAIQERKEIENTFIGKIEVKAIRNGDEEVLKQISDIEQYPINSFTVTDNGIGLNKENLISFAEFDSEKKLAIGGKGVGRLICLKAFNKLIVKSIYQNGSSLKLRKFEYRKSKEGFHDYEDNLQTNQKSTGTSLTLSLCEAKYQNFIPKSLMEIGRQIVNHFQLYFIQGIQPEIIIKNQDDIEINLNNLFEREFEKEILQSHFTISKQSFSVFISKSFKAQSHKIHYCAHERTVKSEGLSKSINDFNSKVVDGETEFYFQVFVVGDYLNKNVNESRTSFNFTIEEYEDEIDLEEITLSKIRKETIKCVEELLKDFLTKVRKEKMEFYVPIIEQEYPNYNTILQHKKEQIEKLPAGLSKQELDIKLYEIESEWRLDVKSKGLELIDKEKDITQLDNYKERYSEFLTNFNEIGQSDLARYIVHRRAVIDLLDKLIELNEENKFENEDIVHSLFFPIRETGKTITTDKQNLWLLDERLTYNKLLASDKLFKQVEELNSDSSKRMDLVVKKEDVFENATLYSEDEYPFESFTIVEFKKPERDNYKQGSYKDDPIKQVRTYVEEIVNGNEKVRGKRIEASKKTPFYCYIVADITPTLQSILDYESFDQTQDGLGYFRFYETNTSRAYIEVLPFKKIIKDAKQRNKILFDQLKLI
ncbi:sensor histidine kinase [Galbibacter sp. BG1]|uniref:ATP-binding protein n=1 Tax=Galbibacter sp. BG1 TaxID=1170699 RepID=UPI0015BE0DF1|nr:ATP-binding protein [Galbibacter sp. BG1]QLE01984.1 sensor histidine kinase [Galbibacter sp. BG1]